MGNYDDVMGCGLTIFTISIILALWKFLDIIIWIFNHIHISIN